MVVRSAQRITLKLRGGVPRAGAGAAVAVMTFEKPSGDLLTACRRHAGQFSLLGRTPARYNLTPKSSGDLG